MNFYYSIACNLLLKKFPGFFHPLNINQAQEEKKEGGWMRSNWSNKPFYCNFSNR